MYLWLIRLVSFFNLWRSKSKVIYLMSFDNNVEFIKRLAEKLSDKSTELVVLYHPDNEAAATDLAAFGIKTVEFKDGFRFVNVGIPLIMQARLVFCDNYYAFLAGLVRSSKTKIVQIWHANGAIKTFGWEDLTTAKRSSSDKRRFQAVYDHFDEYIVGSKAMGQVFVNSYHAKKRQMQLLGYPRCDQYFDQEWIKETRQRILRSAPELQQKRVILYAPTYRLNKDFSLPKNLVKALLADPNSTVIIKLHPVHKDREKVLQKIENPRIHFYHQFDINELLTVADTLVTDYSSVVFDYSLINKRKQVIFFMFDLDSYKKDPGIQKDLFDWLPEKPIKTVTGLSEAIASNQSTDFSEFNRRWNTYNDGEATNRVINHYLQKLNIQ